MRPKKQTLMFPEVGGYAIEHFNGVIVMQAVGKRSWMGCGESRVKIISSTNPKYSAGETWDWDIRIANPISIQQLARKGIKVNQNAPS